jgi:hypothetical protein
MYIHISNFTIKQNKKNRVCYVLDPGRIDNSSTGDKISRVRHASAHHGIIRRVGSNKVEGVDLNGQRRQTSSSAGNIIQTRITTKLIYCSQKRRRHYIKYVYMRYLLFLQSENVVSESDHEIQVTMRTSIDKVIAHSRNNLSILFQQLFDALLNILVHFNGWSLSARSAYHTRSRRGLLKDGKRERHAVGSDTRRLLAINCRMHGVRNIAVHRTVNTTRQSRVKHTTSLQETRVTEITM